MTFTQGVVLRSCVEEKKGLAGSGWAVENWIIGTSNLANPQLICDHWGDTSATYVHRTPPSYSPWSILKQNFFHHLSSHDVQEKIKDGMQNLIQAMHVATAFNLTRSRPLRVLPKLIAATVYRLLAKKGASEWLLFKIARAILWRR